MIPPVVEVPQAARKASRLRMIRQNPAVLKKRNVCFCIGLALLKQMYDTLVGHRRLVA